MRAYLFLIIILLSSQLKSQNSGDYPVDIPIILSSSFGELRPNHFHSGIDIKTQGIEGFEVFSIGDGYISRIQITLGGNGKALYIKHDNGQSSVYAHLKEFSPRIEQIVKNIQYSNKSYTLRKYPKVDEYRISKKEVIGYSGNTGRSTAPHLHYELRDENDKPLNPMAYKSYAVEDTIPPILLDVYFKKIFLDDKGVLSYNQSDFSKLNLKKINSSIYVSDTLKINGLIGFGVNSYDKMNNTWNKMGLSFIETNVNGKKVFEMDFNKFSFDEWGHINNFIDYATYKKFKYRIQKLFIEKSNPLSMYNRKLGDGLVEINEDELNYLYNIKLSDYNKNLTEVLIPIKFDDSQEKKIKEVNSDHLYYINNDSVYDINLKNSSVKIFNNTFYSDTFLDFTEKKDYLHLDMDTIALLKPITIKFNLNRYEKSMVDKLFIAKMDDIGGYSFVSNSIQNDKMIARVKTLGDYQLKSDTIPPVVNLLNIRENQWVSNLKKIKIKISDKQSGIKSYNAWINGQWVLLEFNPAKGILSYDFRDNVNSSTSRNNLLINIEDNSGNISEIETIFYRKIK